MTKSPSELFDLLSARSTAVAYELTQPIARVLTEARALAGGDLDKALVMLVIIMRSNQHPDYRKLDPPEVAAAPPAPLPSLGTNVLSIAGATGIPKESVRRKVLELIEAGWVVRTGRTLHYSTEGYRAVAPAREALLRMYVQGCQAIERLLEERPARRKAG